MAQVILNIPQQFITDYLDTIKFLAPKPEGVSDTVWGKSGLIEFLKQTNNQRKTNLLIQAVYETPIEDLNLT